MCVGRVFYFHRAVSRETFKSMGFVRMHGLLEIKSQPFPRSCSSGFASNFPEGTEAKRHKTCAYSQLFFGVHISECLQRN